MSRTARIIGCGAGVLVLILTAQVSEAAGKGPRASISVATVCEHEFGETTLTVELRIRDKTSGNAIPLVTDWNIDASLLERGVPGNQWQTFASEGQSGQIGVPVTIKRVFDLCAMTGGILSVLDDARTLNGLAEVTYGKSDGTGGVSGPLRTINNRCSDDPETLDVVEPSGIKLSPEELEAIDAACPMAP